MQNPGSFYLQCSVVAFNLMICILPEYLYLYLYIYFFFNYSKLWCETVIQSFTGGKLLNKIHSFVGFW